MLMSRDGTWTGSGHSSFHPNCCFTLEEGLQNAIHDSFRKEPPLKHGMVGPAGTDDPLQVVGPANIRHMGRVTNVLFEFGPCVKKQMQNVWRRKRVIHLMSAVPPEGPGPTESLLEQQGNDTLKVPNIYQTDLSSDTGT